MKKIFGFLAILLAFSANSQLLDPVKWKTSVNQKSNDEFELVMEATIDDHWHMFSQYTPDGGSLPSEFDYKNQDENYQLVGKTTESPYKKVYSEIFEVDEYQFEDKATFKQLIKVSNTNLKEVKVSVYYQVCKEQCIQQDKDFIFKLPEIKKVVKEEPQKVAEELKKEEKKTIKQVFQTMQKN